MKYEDLRNFILYDMKPDTSLGEPKNYQPVMILVLNQNHGKATKQEIMDVLEKANPNRVLPDGSFNTVFKTLQGHKIVERKGDQYFLLDYETIDKYFGRKAEITKCCYEKLQDLSFVASTLESIPTNNSSNEETRFFIALGPWSNWEHTLNNPPFRWGVNPSSASNVGVFNALRPGDIVYYYANRDNPTPFSKRGLFGVGKVIRKYDEDKERYWPDEKLKDQIIYKHRFEIESLKLVQSDSEMLSWIDGLPFTKGLNRIANEDTLKQLIDNTEKIWNIKLNDSTTNVFLSEKDFEDMVKAIPLVIEYNKNKLQSDKTIPKAEDIQLCARLQYYCALRISELLKLTPSKINFDNNEITMDETIDEQVIGIATIHPSIKDDLEKYLKDKTSDEILFLFSRQLLWSYYKKAGQFAELNLFKEQTGREIEGMSTTILRESRAKHMEEKMAGEGLIRLKLRLPISHAIFKHNLPTLQNLKDWERKEFESTLNLIETNTNYLLLRHKIGSSNQWRDDIGKQYHFGKIPNYKKLIPGTKTIWYDREDGDFYFWGHGEISRIEKESDEHFHAHYDHFIFFNEPEKANPRTENVIPKKGSDSIKEKILNLPTWNHQISMPKITKEIYDEIIGIVEKKYSVIDEKQNTFEDEKLSLLTPAEIKAGYAKISDELLIPEEKITEIVTALASGRHVLLAGPIGTGKTRLAKIIPEIFWDKVGGYYSEDHTATADWSTQDVIGGIYPKMEDGKPVYDIQHGCVVDTVRKNWENDVDGGMRMTLKEPQKNPPYKGTWLIIDEFNRADIDKAFGQLFTALRTRWLKIPTDQKGVSYKNLKIPEDYRIIGTLNTADKHFLFQLSDALKSRFAYIEIDIPKKEQWEKEIYYAMKNALEELDINGFSKIVLDDTNKKIDKERSDTDFYNRVMQAYHFLDTIRVFKKLGTAILKLIYQNLIVGTIMTENSKTSLDNALTSNLIPQLENLSVTFVSAIHAMHSDTLISYLKEAYKSPNRQSYVEAFEKILNYLEITNKASLLSDFANGNLKIENEEVWRPIQSAYDDKKNYFEFELTQIKQSMDDLITSMVI